MATHSQPAERWIADDCEKAHIWPINRQRAEGILSIHATCDPPCPRAESARRYLTEDEAS